MSERSRRKWKPLVAAAICLVAVGALLFGVLRSNIVYYRTVPEALKVATESDRGGRFRLGGIVMEGSVKKETGGRVTFRLTDGTDEVSVRHIGDPPDLFREGESILSEGRFNTNGTVFESDKITIRHGNEYKPPGASSSSSSAVADGDTEEK